MPEYRTNPPKRDKISPDDNFAYNLPIDIEYVNSRKYRQHRDVPNPPRDDWETSDPYRFK